MGIKQFIVVFSFLIPIIVSGQNYPRFELYQLKQGTDSGQFIVTGLDSNLAFNNILRFRSADSTFLIGTDTVAVKSDIAPSLLGIIDAGLGVEVNQVNGQIFIESLSIEDSIYNGTASLISKGTPLYATGVQGNYWSIAPADASDPSKMPVVVIAGEDIVSGAVGLGLIKGHIKQVNTTGLADGAEVYVASGGGYTATKPTAEGVIIQRLGTVIKGNNANGSGIINLGNEAYWSDYTSLTKLRDTLVVFRDSITNQIRDSLVFYVDRVELNDTLINYVDRVELNDSLTLYPNRIELGDSLTLYPNRIELGDSLALYPNRVELGDSLALYPNRVELGDSLLLYVDRVELGDSLLLYVDRVELGDTASAIRTDIPLIINDSLTARNFLTENQNITLSGDVSGSGTTAITTTVADDSHNHVISNVDNLQTSLDAKQDNLSGSGIVKSTSGTISYITDNSSNWDAAFNDRIYTAAFSGTTTKTLTLTQQDGGTVVANFVDETGVLWSEGSETNEIYYSGKIGVGLTNPDYPFHVSGRGYLTDDLLVYDRIYIGSDFNHLSGSHAPYIDRYSAIGETGMDFYAYNSGVNGPLFRFFDSYNAFQEVFTLNTASSTYQIIGDGDSDFNGDFNIDGRLDVNDSIRIYNLAGVSDVGADANGVLQAATSDTTLKTNIVPNQYGLKKVMDIETIKFSWKDKVSKGSQKEVGFNAQNLKKVIPEATYTIPLNGKLGIKDDAIIATLTKAIQEQQEMIAELQKEIKRIKRKIK